MVGICRLCASFKPIKELSSLEEFEKSFLDTIEHCCRIRLALDADNGRPKKICVDCTETFKKIGESLAKVQSSQQLLNQFFNQNANAEYGNGKRKLDPAYSDETFLMDGKTPCTPREPSYKKTKMEVTPVPFGLRKAIKNHLGTEADTQSNCSDSDVASNTPKVGRKSGSRKQIDVKTTPTWNLTPACCMKCDTKIVGADRLRTHVCVGVVAKFKDIIRCGYCSKTFKSFQYYMMHVAYHLPHLKRRWVSLISSRTFNRGDSMRSHFLFRQHRCIVCSLEIEGLMTAHMVTAHSVNCNTND